MRGEWDGRVPPQCAYYRVALECQLAFVQLGDKPHELRPRHFGSHPPLPPSLPQGLQDRPRGGTGGLSVVFTEGGREGGLKGGREGGGACLDTTLFEGGKGLAGVRPCFPQFKLGQRVRGREGGREEGRKGGREEGRKGGRDEGSNVG